MRPAENIDKLIKKLSYKASAETHERVFGNVMRALDESEKQKTGAAAPDIWRLIMRSSITKVAVAAAVIVVAVLGVHYMMAPSITFADVVKPLLNAKAMIFDVIIGDEETGTALNETIVGQKIRRTISNLPGITMIIDLENSRMLALNDINHSAGYADISGVVKERHQSYIKFLREVITKLKDNHQELGEQEIDGRKAVVFEARGHNQGVKVWADPETALPIRVELTLGQMFLIMKNFQFDPPIDESLVSMDVPAGYTLDETEYDMTDVTEQDFIESLRIWAKIIGDGTFPEAIGTENAMNQMPVLGAKMVSLNLPEEEASQMGGNFGKGMLFYQILETDNKGHYAGQGVKLGDASKAIFWYKPEGSETWRVIYGDLSVKDVAEGDLPK
jgi:hypothetical protein